MKELQEELKNISDDQLIDNYLYHKEDYTAEALALMENEIKARGLDIGRTSSGEIKEQSSEKFDLKSEDFIKFDHVFGQFDIQLAAAVLRDNGIIFYIDNPESSETIPLEGIAERQFTIHVHKNFMEAARELLDEHFHKSEGKYKLREIGAIGRLKAFTFHDIHISEKEAVETVDVSLTAEEKETIIKYGKRVLSEIDRIEGRGVGEEGGFRAVFYFDNIESLITRLAGKENLLLTKTDLLTILEILQIFCDEKEFPAFMEPSIGEILNFFQS